METLSVIDAMCKKTQQLKRYRLKSIYFQTVTGLNLEVYTLIVKLGYAFKYE
jgi:hypothetical protein